MFGLQLSTPPSVYLHDFPDLTSLTSPSPLAPPQIPQRIFTAFLDVRVPLTIASVYAATVTMLNRRATGKPYEIARTRLFRWFVAVHNLFLAVYSLWTFLGMIGAIHRSIVTTRGVEGVVESLCKIRNDTRAGGIAVSVGEENKGWMRRNGDGGAGLWSEGLAYYGWWFYLSKFYEVVDTAIIIAKGKRSSLLQTYHHAGAMICMWAGIRYMAPPIWLFCVFNSLIHSLMYTYYTLSTLSLHVPSIIKRSLTSLQITQFIVGGSFAAIHLFIYFTPAVAEGSVSEGPVSCLSGNGEVYLFVTFFLDSYTQKGRARRAEKTKRAFEKAAARVGAGKEKGCGETYGSGVVRN
ncbi:hypothetical protein RUND412_010092 [Rhizina undulata]